MVIVAGGKVAKMATAESKMATRVPSTGLKMAKMANHMEMGDTSDTLDGIDTLLSVPAGGRLALTVGLPASKVIMVIT
jgi:hypothetical protein